MENTYQVHPWHGISAGENAPEEVTVFVEIVPSDTIKYEVDKASGFLKIDRPQKFSNIVPALYGFVPQTYCDEGSAELARSIGAQNVTQGDHDPLDILVLCSHNVNHGNFILDAKPIGGFCMIDKGEADDKIIAVLKDDQTYGGVNDLSDLPQEVIDRLKHYFLTYKSLPGAPVQVAIDQTYGKEHAFKVIKTAMQDYVNAGGSSIK